MRVIGHAVFTSASVLALAVAPHAAWAQGASSGEVLDDDKTIVVTGTNIRGVEVVGTDVQTVSIEEIENSGLGNIGDFMRELPSNLAGGVGFSDETPRQDAGPEGANLSGSQGVNLRGLGALSTLVLVNGRRVPGSGQFGDFVDISTIPTVAIQRVEILPDGASAVYGSDAVGGVVNFILARGSDKAVTTAKLGAATQGGGKEILVGHLQPIQWGTGSLVLAGEYYWRDNVRFSDRKPYSNGSDFSSFGNVDWRSYTARFSPQTNIYGGRATSSSPVIFTVPSGANNSLTVADLTASGPVGNTFDVYERNDVLPKVERFSFYGAFEQEISANAEIYGDLRYTHRENKSELGFEPLVSPLPASSPFYISGIGAPGAPISFGTVLDDRPSAREAKVDSYMATLGAKVGLFSDWTINAAVTYAADDQFRHKERIRSKNRRGGDYVSCALAGPAATSPQCAGLNATPLNPFSTEPLTQAQISEYFGREDLTFESDLWQVTSVVDGTLFALPGGDAKIAFGGEWRREAMEGEVFANTISVTPNEGPYTRTERDAYAAFAELQLPVIDWATVNLAGRYEKFDAKYGSKYSDFNPRIGIDIEPVEGVKLRGSWGTSFHAPPMRFENDDPQPLPGGNAAFLLNTSRFAPCDTSLVTTNGLVQNGNLCSFTVIINSGGAGAGKLKPEQAETWTLGFDIEPVSMPGLRFSMTYFNIEVKNRIQRIQSGQLNSILAEYFATNGGGPFASALIVPTLEEAQAAIDAAKFLGTFGPPIANSAADVQLIVNATQLNIASLKEDGLDFSLSYDTTLNSGMELGVFARGTYLFNYDTQAAPGLPFDSQLGKYSFYGSPVDLRAQFGVHAKAGDVGTVLTVNYVDSYECGVGFCYVPDATGAPVINANPVPIDAWWTVDLAVNFDVSSWSKFLNGTRLGLNIRNLLDQDPPFVPGGSPNQTLQIGYDSANHTIIGRTVGLTLRKEW